MTTVFRPDLRAVRSALVDVLRREIPELRTVYPYERRQTLLDELPCAWVWGTGASPADVQPFGATTVDFAYQVRMTHAVTNGDVEAQVYHDELVVRLINAFEANPFLDDSGIVDNVQWSNIEDPDYSSIQNVPVFSMQMTIVATITA